MRLQLEGTLQEKEKTLLQYLTNRQASCHDVIGKLGSVSMNIASSWDQEKSEFIDDDTFFVLDDHPADQLTWAGRINIGASCIEGPIRTMHLDLEPWAYSQLLNRLGIPVSYFNRCSYILQADNFDYWRDKLQDKKIMLRMMDNKVRAVFSSRFNPEMDDHILYPVVFDALKKRFSSENIFLRSFCTESDLSVMQVVFKDTQVEYNGHIAFAGLLIINSEVGRSSIWIKPCVVETDTRGINTKPVILSDKRSVGSLFIRHIGDLTTERISKAAQKAYEVAQVGVVRLLQASKETVSEPLKEAERIINLSDVLSHKLFADFMVEIQEKEEMNRLELIKGMMNAVKHLPLFQRQRAEESIGHNLDLFSGHAAAITQFMDEIQQIEEQ